MSDVPDELLREILSRLLVAPLLRFRCVSKSWKDLIDSQQFIKHHLNHSRKSNSNLNIVLRSLPHLHSVDFDSLNETNMATFKELSNPLRTLIPSVITEILGSCDGLLVLRNHKDDITILWNPSVKRFHVIPCTSIPSYKIKFPCYGFGYDVMSDDYKLIRIIQSELKLYSLKSDSWRTIQDFPYHMSRPITKEGVLANGALHWILTGDSDDSVAAFDLGTEEYRLIQFPKFANDDIITGKEVAVLGGCLSLVCYVNWDRVDLWVMKEYGVQESWSILFSYDNHGDGARMRPLAYSKCGRKVLLVYDGNALIWYDLDKKSTHVPMVQMPKKFIYETYTCLQSLVLLNNGTRDCDLVPMKKQKSRIKNHSEHLFESESESESESPW